MKTIVDYLIKKQTYEHNVLGRDFILVLNRADFKCLREADEDDIADYINVEDL